MVPNQGERGAGMNTLLWYWEITWDYIYEMLPCMALAAVAFFLLRPVRLRRFEQLGLASSVWREGAFLIFVLFCAGLAALTVFPSGFWGALMHGYPPAEGWFGWHGRGMYLQVTILAELLERWRRLAVHRDCSDFCGAQQRYQ